MVLGSPGGGGSCLSCSCSGSGFSKIDRTFPDTPRESSGSSWRSRIYLFLFPGSEEGARSLLGDFPPVATFFGCFVFCLREWHSTQRSGFLVFLSPHWFPLLPTSVPTYTTALGFCLTEALSPPQLQPGPEVPHCSSLSTSFRVEIFSTSPQAEGWHLAVKPGEQAWPLCWHQPQIQSSRKGSLEIFN